MKIYIGRFVTMVLLVSFLVGCVPSGANIAKTPVILSNVSKTVVPESPDYIGVTQLPIPTYALTPETMKPSSKFTPTPTSNSTEESMLLTLTSWKNNITSVYELSIGCLDKMMPCFGDMKLLFEVQNIEMKDIQWSPDGKLLAFTGKHEVDTKLLSDIFIIDADGQNLINITNVRGIVSNNEFQTIAQNARWSPDSQTLAYNLCNVICYVFATDITTGETVNLLEKLSLIETYRNADIQLGGWSPTGKQIAILIDDLHSNSQVYMSNLDGSELLQITDTLEENYSVCYSPDGQWFLVNRANSPNDLSRLSSLFIIRTDDFDEIQITNSEVFYYLPDWSLDSQWIVVKNINMDDSEQIMILNLKGNSFSLDIGINKYSNPVWRPAEKP